MTNAANVVVSFLELLEAEGRELHRGANKAIEQFSPQLKRVALRLGLGIGLALAAGLMMAACAALGLWGSYLTFLETQTPISAAFTVAGLALFFALLLGGIAVWINR